ncbi:hypothetical protein [Microcoleus vaginatus]|uniref:hypothetical protein n=1 Tax=Microcoleus vaginatus TaxID=119532 RepID=UPI00403FB25F
MTALFRRIQPSKKLRITVRLIAQLLKISQNQIKRIESWVFVVFVHRRGQRRTIYLVPQPGRMAKCDRPSYPNLPQPFRTLAAQNIHSLRQPEIQKTISPKNT